MRLWSIHPQYLDGIGLVACWRESLLAQKVLLGQTKGYQHHPQLIRFKQCEDPVAQIGAYLAMLAAEARVRNYQFDTSKIHKQSDLVLMPISDQQLEYEFAHLKNKLEVRQPWQYHILSAVDDIEPNPCFSVYRGKIEDWEVLT